MPGTSPNSKQTIMPATAAAVAGSNAKPDQKQKSTAMTDLRFRLGSVIKKGEQAEIEQVFSEVDSQQAYHIFILQDKDGKLPLHEALERNNFTECEYVVKKLLSRFPYHQLSAKNKVKNDAKGEGYQEYDLEQSVNHGKTAHEYAVSKFGSGTTIPKLLETKDADLFDYWWYITHRHETTGLSNTRNQIFEDISAALLGRKFDSAVTIIDENKAPSKWLKFWGYAVHNAKILTGLVYSHNDNTAKGKRLSELHSEFIFFARAHPEVIFASIIKWKKIQNDAAVVSVATGAAGIASRTKVANPVQTCNVLSYQMTTQGEYVPTQAEIALRAVLAEAVKDRPVFGIQPAVTADVKQAHGVENVNGFGTDKSVAGPLPVQLSSAEPLVSATTSFPFLSLSSYGARASAAGQSAANNAGDKFGTVPAAGANGAGFNENRVAQFEIDASVPAGLAAAAAKAAQAKTDASIVDSTMNTLNRH